MEGQYVKNNYNVFFICNNKLKCRSMKQFYTKINVLIHIKRSLYVYNIV